MTEEQKVVVLGEKRYRVESPWGVLPEGMTYGVISKSAADSNGNVYVCQRRDPPVICFDTDGNFLRSWGDGVIRDPHGIYVSSDDRVLVVDRDFHQVLAFDTTGNLLFTLGERERPQTQAPFNHPTDAAVGPKGDIYVSDGYGNTMVHWFSPEYELKRSWGGRGSGPGEFVTPHGIAVLGDGRVLVGDRENNRLQVFSPEGDYLRDFGPFYKPMDIFVDRDDLIYVSDQVPRLTLLNNEGEILGSCKPVPVMPHGCRGDPAGNLYFVETRSSSIAKLAPVH